MNYFFHWKWFFFRFSRSMIPNLMPEISLCFVLAFQFGRSASSSIFRNLARIREQYAVCAHLRNEGCWVTSYQFLLPISHFTWTFSLFWIILTTQFHLTFYIKYNSICIIFRYFTAKTFDSNNQEFFATSFPIYHIYFLGNTYIRMCKFDICACLLRKFSSRYIKPHEGVELDRGSTASPLSPCL